MNTQQPKYIALDPKTGALLRDATPEETAAWLAQPCRHEAFRKDVMVGAVLIHEDNGPGQWFGGAGF